MSFVYVTCGLLSVLRGGDNLISHFRRLSRSFLARTAPLDLNHFVLPCADSQVGIADYGGDGNLRASFNKGA